jgi:VWFA-related protein
MLDNSISQHQALESERSASYNFLEKLLRTESDTAAIIRFGTNIDLLQNFTSSRVRLQKALRGVREGGSIRNPPSSDPKCGFRGTLLYESIVYANNKVIRNQQGRKALIVLSNGIDVGSCETLNSAIEFSQRANTLVYGILFSDQPPEYRTNGKRALQRIAEETGGHLFEISTEQTIEQIYVLIEAELRSQYSLGFSSDQPSGSRAYRKLRVLTKNQSLLVQARQGYYAE